ncbi:hypothetical protein CTAYLR_000699 [Chrysophaeum taylorii]|uniref:Ankyrin repeat protein n=1 Tax=Chrysophaeum taylorii TaxID=2483200 RepID=A0AAD7U8U7_9STRA|nr:hypothetical protein CTAYLR_000699 [Chrysophaeum taylorii]
MYWYWWCVAGNALRPNERVRLFTDPRVPGAWLDPSLLSAPHVAAASRSGLLDPKLRFARQVLNISDATNLVRRVPQFVSAPLATRLAPRHAYRLRHDLPRDVETLCDRKTLSEPEVDACERFRRGPRHAARVGDSLTLEALISHGWSPQDRDRRGASALHLAAGHGRVECMSVIPLSVNDEDDRGATPLHWASVGVSGNAFGVGAKLEACRWLLDRGANASASTRDGNACLHWAAWAGGAASVELLLDHGAALDAQNRRGCTAAHWAAAGGDLETLELLRVRGLGLAELNDAGHSPLEHAVSHGRTAATEWFLRRDIVDPGAVEWALELAKLDPSNPARRAIATDLSPYGVIPDI